ncbi:MAG: restriction endonuclease subunit S [Acidimicrobiales bacterium]|nr:restriction endonuclease subunit S [Acidimicrobiales bacterium]
MTAAADWPRVQLGEIGQSLIGLTYRPDDVKSSGTLVLRSSNIQDGSLAFDDNVYVDCAIPERIRVRENDILICVRNGSRRLIGKSVILDRRVVGQTFGAFMAVYRADSNPFLQYFFKSDDFKRQIDEHLGATINQITNGSLNSFVVALPSPTEQREIASRLQDLDQLIAAIDRLITKNQAIKQGMMQQLLTGETRLPGFTERWRTATVGDLTDQHRRIVDPRLDRGKWFHHFSLPAFDEAETPVIQPGSEIDSIKFVVPTGAVLVSKLNPRIPRIWAPERIGIDSIASTEFVVLTPQPGNSRLYLKWLMKSNAVVSRMKLLATGTTGSHARIHPAQVAAIEVRVPGEREQEAIGTTLSDAEAEVDLLRKRIAKAKSVRHGMVQELLSGRTRLPVEEVTA